MHSLANSPAFVSVERFNPLQGASAITRKYQRKLDKLLSNYESDIAKILSPYYSPAYVRGEIDADLHRLGRVFREHQDAAFKQAYEADQIELRK